MQFLFDSNGYHIASEVDGQLHSPTGENIGHLMPEGFFIDMNGYYLGEIVMENRLMHRLYSQYEGSCYGSMGNYGNVGNYGDPGNYGSLGYVDGFQDIDKSKL